MWASAGSAGGVCHEGLFVCLFFLRQTELPLGRLIGKNFVKNKMIQGEGLIFLFLIDRLRREESSTGVNSDSTGGQSSEKECVYTNRNQTNLYTSILKPTWMTCIWEKKKVPRKLNICNSITTQ